MRGGCYLYAMRFSSISLLLAIIAILAALLLAVPPRAEIGPRNCGCLGPLTSAHVAPYFLLVFSAKGLRQLLRSLSANL